MEKTTFEEVTSATWTKDEDDFGLILVKTAGGVSGAVGEFMLVWDEYYPISQALSEEDATKMYNLLLHAGEMYRLLRDIDTPEAQALVKKVE